MGRDLLSGTTFWFQLHEKDRYFLLYIGSGRRLEFLSDTIETTVKSHTLDQYRIIVPRHSLRSKQAEIFLDPKILNCYRVVRGYSSAYVTVSEHSEERFSRSLLLSEVPRGPNTIVLRSECGI